MDLKQMRYFLALAEERNFSRAAERLHMAQPPLSRMIRTIEEELGATLFVRTPKGVELTAAGQALLEEVPNILSLAKRAEEKTQLAGQGLVGRLDVGIFGSGILNVVPRVLSTFHKLRPEVNIGLHNMSKSEQIQALRERRIMVGFARLVPEEADLSVEVVLREPILVALYKGHRLCSKDEITIRDIDGESMILYPKFAMTGLAQNVVKAFERTGCSLKVEQEVEDVLTAIALVSSGFGLCVTTESAASLRLPGVIYRPLRSPHLKDIEMSCFYRREETSPILQAFLNVVRRYSKA